MESPQLTEARRKSEQAWAEYHELKKTTGGRKAGRALSRATDASAKYFEAKKKEADNVARHEMD